MHWVYLLVASTLSLAGLGGWFIGICIAWNHPRVFDSEMCACGYCRRGLNDSVKCPECGGTALRAQRYSRCSVAIGVLIGTVAAFVACVATIFVRYRAFGGASFFNDDLWYHPFMFSSVVGTIVVACGIVATRYSLRDMGLIAFGLVVSACFASFLWTRADLSVLGLRDNEGQVFYAGRAMQLVGAPLILGLGFYVATRCIAGIAIRVSKKASLVELQSPLARSRDEAPKSDRSDRSSA